MKRMLTKISDSLGQKEFDIYDYAFEIQMPERVYIFYTEKEIESKRWVRVLSLIVSMNQAGIDIKRGGISPFDYEKYLVSKQVLAKIERYETEENEEKKEEEVPADYRPVIRAGNFKPQKTQKIVLD